MKWWIVSLCTLASLCAQNNPSGRVTGRIVGRGVGPMPGEVLVVMSGGGVRLNSIATDAQGIFTMDLPPGQVLLVARAEGYASEERQLQVRPAPGNAEAVFTLSPAGQLSGRVFDGNGAGVPGAKVWVNYAGEARSWRLADEAGGEAADAFGYFTIPMVAQGRPFVLEAESEEWLPSSSGTLVLRGREMAGVVLLLSRRGTMVRGRVIDGAGNPVTAAAIRLRAIPAPGEFSAEQRASIAFARSMNKTTFSAADGSYAFTGIPAGRVVVTAEAAGRRAAAEADTALGREVEIVLVPK